jgi:hypothetical protein
VRLLPLFRTHFGLKYLLNAGFGSASRGRPRHLPTPTHRAFCPPGAHCCPAPVARATCPPTPAPDHACGHHVHRVQGAMGGKGATCSPSTKCTTTGAPKSQFKPQTCFSHVRCAFRAGTSAKAQSCWSSASSSATAPPTPCSSCHNAHAAARLLDPSKVPRAAVDHALAQARLEQLCLCI